MARQHRCKARLCEARVDRDKLMCRRHWYMVPQPLRRRINAAWHEVQWWKGADGARYRAAVTAWREVVNEAIRAVARHEGAPS